MESVIGMLRNPQRITMLFGAVALATLLWTASAEARLLGDENE